MKVKFSVATTFVTATYALVQIAPALAQTQQKPPVTPASSKTTPRSIKPNMGYVNPFPDGFMETYRQQVSLNNQAAELAMVGKTDEAVAIYKESIALDPARAVSEPGNAFAGIGDILASEGRDKEAAVEYDKLWTFNGARMEFCGDEIIQFKYALVLHRAGRFDDSFSAYKRALLKDPFVLNGINYVPFTIEVNNTNYPTVQLETAVHLALGIIYYSHSDHVQSVEQFKAAIHLKPNYAPTYFFLGETLRLSSPETRKAAGGSEAAFKKATELGDSRAKRRAQQELGLLPHITAMETGTIVEENDKRIKESEQERERVRIQEEAEDSARVAAKPPMFYSWPAKRSN